MTDHAPVDLPAECDPDGGADGEALRLALRRVVAPVVVVTAHPAGGERRGATIGSFTSLALDPPLVAFNVMHGSQLHAALADADTFAVNLLAADQAALADHFAEPDLSSEDQFAHVSVAPAPVGPPVLAGTLGTLVCATHARVEAGDHTLFVGRVLHVRPGREAPPLLYYARSYRTVGEEV